MLLSLSTLYLEGMIVVFFIFEVCDVTQTVSLLVSDFNESREALLGALEFVKKRLAVNHGEED